MPWVDDSLCTGCGSCADTCPAGAIDVEERASIDQGACIMCNACVYECPVSAIALRAPSGSP